MTFIEKLETMGLNAQQKKDVIFLMMGMSARIMKDLAPMPPIVMATILAGSFMTSMHEEYLEPEESMIDDELLKKFGLTLD